MSEEDPFSMGDTATILMILAQKTEAEKENCGANILASIQKENQAIIEHVKHYYFDKFTSLLNLFQSLPTDVPITNRVPDYVTNT